MQNNMPANEQWKAAPLAKIIDFIIPRYHDKHRSHLPTLIEMTEKVENRHSSHPNCPQGLAALLRSILDDLSNHMMKEERVLFPLIKAGNGPMAAMPISIMEQEHADADQEVEQTKAMTDNLTLPENACTMWTNLYNGIAEFINDLDEHIDLENNILFPRALRGEQP